MVARQFLLERIETRNADAAKKFYGATLGWTFEAMPMPEGTYWIAKMGAPPVGGIFTMNGPDFEDVPEHWFAYIAVDDVDARVKKLKAAGGNIMREPFDVPDVGRIAIVQDATASCSA